jgi:quercetin dioxygenase-like cupin family protein
MRYGNTLQPALFASLRHWRSMVVMNSLTRRQLCASLPALAAVAAFAEAGQAQSSTNQLSTSFEHSRAFPFDQLPLRYSDAGAPTRDICQGRVPTGELIELHETTVEAGKMPHPAHSHPHEEFILVREGTMALILDGQEHPLPAGSVGYTAPNEIHGFKNIGTTAATYFVFSLSKIPGSKSTPAPAAK